MPEDSDVSQWISQLAHPEASQRLLAGGGIYRVASKQFLPILRKWTEDSDFLQLLNIPETRTAGKPIWEQADFTTGIAVTPDRFEQIWSANGSPALASVPADQDAKEFELQFGERLDFDILTTRDPGGDGAIARFLRKSGEGIQQIEIEVSSADRAAEILISRAGLTAVYPATRPGANGTLVNFFLVTAPNNRKLLIELVQPTTGSRERR
jgi:hypothetical protein